MIIKEKIINSQEFYIFKGYNAFNKNTLKFNLIEVPNSDKYNINILVIKNDVIL